MITKNKAPKIIKSKHATTDIFTMLVKSEFGLDCFKEYKFHEIRKWRVDYVIPDLMLAIEVEGGIWTGGRHTNSVGFLKDMEKYNELTCLGWRLVRVTPKTLFSAGCQLIKRNIIGSKHPTSIVFDRRNLLIDFCSWFKTTFNNDNRKPAFEDVDDFLMFKVPD